MFKLNIDKKELKRLAYSNVAALKIILLYEYLSNIDEELCHGYYYYFQGWGNKFALAMFNICFLVDHLIFKGKLGIDELIAKSIYFFCYFCLTFFYYSVYFWLLRDTFIQEFFKNVVFVFGQFMVGFVIFERQRVKRWVRVYWKKKKKTK